MRVRFPLLYMIELQNSLQQQVEERTMELKEEKNNSEKLLIELTQALATTIEWRKITQKKRPLKNWRIVSKSGKLDSNQRPQRPERRALPTALLPVKNIFDKSLEATSTSRTYSIEEPLRKIAKTWSNFLGSSNGYALPTALLPVK